MIPWAMNRDLKFCKDYGPILKPMIPGETKINKKISIKSKLNPIKESILALRKDLSNSINIIGFAGAPWTLACYMIEGRSELSETRNFMGLK